MTSMLVTGARLLAGVSGVALLVAAYRTRTAWESPSARSFSLLVGVLGGSAVAVAAVALTTTGLSLLWLYGYLAIPVAFGAFALDYYGLDLLESRRRRAIAALPALGGAAAGTVLIADRALSGASAGMSAGTATVSTLPAVALDLLRGLREIGLYYRTGVLLVAAALVLAAVFRYDHLDGGLAATLSFVGGWPWVAYLLMPEVAAVSSFGLSLAFVAGCYAASVVAIAVAIGPAGLFESLPAAGNVGSRTVLDSMDDAVLVVDGRGRVLRANAVARRTFGARDAFVGRPLSDVLVVDADALRTSGRLSLDTVEGTRQFRATASTVEGRDGHGLGTAFVLRDVTRERTREQRLQVLNRVLRHNLRNDMNVIRGHAELIADGGGIDPSTGAEQIRTTATDLVELGDRAREVERMMALDARADAEVDLAAVVSEIVADLGDAHPEVTLTTALPTDATLPGDGRVLRTVLRNVVENACEHNDADEPLVVVSADRTDDAFRVAVGDNGPGIPEMERTVIDAGVEDPLEHGSGLGLWAVRWGVTRLGGRLSFADNEPRGTVVRIDLPTGRHAASPGSAPAAAD